ncbi:FtsX-like permease family protein [Spirosoma aureum]|uniref:FtsX-like permease family protein n=1 Tax=Spirosoma aureum TaxID=2692134 RepID=A0A6G9AVN6_9BACT|nr:ABC transporter permease [Spirosoma aureum]QIP16541.1 FtsX-like permease family protein [Spirosoma aureum]
MLRTYLRITIRRLWQNRLYSFLNVLGLATSLTAMVFAILYLNEEHSFDSFHQPNLYRITSTQLETRGGQPVESGGTGQVQGPAFKAKVPEVQEYVRVMGGDISGMFVANQKAVKLNPYFVDSSFFAVFSFQLIRGNPTTALQGTNTVVITERTARKLFNSLDVIGKTLLEDGPSGNKLGASIITGVVQDPPSNSSIQFDALFPFQFMQASFEDTNWLSAYLSTFVLIHPQADLTAVVRKFEAVYAHLAREQVAANRRRYGFDPSIRYGLQSVRDMHLNPLYRLGESREGGIMKGNNPMYAYLFLGISGFMLLMASINFINLSLAQSLKRTNEVGIRKITGSSQWMILIHFLGESAILCLLALGLAFLATLLLLPVFNQLAQTTIAFSQILDGQPLLYTASLFITNVLIAGLYPAFVLSRFKPTQVLYHKIQLGGRSWLGQGLLMIQFSMAVLLLIGTLMVYIQMDFVRTKDLGYNPYQVIHSHLPYGELKSVQSLLRAELLNQPSILQTSFGSELAGTYATRVGSRTIESRYQYIDENYLSVLGIELKAGRNLSASFVSDKTDAVLVNERFVKAAGLSNPVGMRIRLHNNYTLKPLTISGIVKDFHVSSFRDPIPPLVMFVQEDQSSGVWLKVALNRQQEAVAVLKKAYQKAFPQVELEYGFLDELNAKAYELDQKWQRMVSYATLLALVICGLGVFGLARLASQQRTKELGVRKVLGATVIELVVLVVSDFIKPVLLAVVIASPVAAWILGVWLQNFAYRSPMPWWLFAGAGLFAFLITVVTVSLQSMKVALLNPALSLRSD